MPRALFVLLASALTACAAGKTHARAEPAAAGPAAAGPTTSAAAAPDGKPKSLYQRLGGQPAVEAVVDALLARALKDETINYTWAGSHLLRVRTRLVELVCAGTGGGCRYTGRDMASVHRGQGITAEQFGALVKHLVDTLDSFKVPEKEKGELLAILGPMKGAIVEER